MTEKNEPKGTTATNTQEHKNEQCKPIAIRELMTHIPLEPQNVEYTELKNIDQILHGLRYETSVGRNNITLNR